MGGGRTDEVCREMAVKKLKWKEQNRNEGGDGEKLREMAEAVSKAKVSLFLSLIFSFFSSHYFLDDLEFSSRIRFFYWKQCVFLLILDSHFFF